VGAWVITESSPFSVGSKSLRTVNIDLEKEKRNEKENKKKRIRESLRKWGYALHFTHNPISAGNDKPRFSSLTTVE